MNTGYSPAAGAGGRAPKLDRRTIFCRRARQLILCFVPMPGPTNVNEPDKLSNPLRTAEVRRQFDRAAAGFANGDFVHRHCFAGLLERLQPIPLDAGHVLDLGSAAGRGSRQLAKRFRRARISSLDFSAAMLQKAKADRSRFARISEVQANATALPFTTGAFDLVVANLLLPWLGDPQPVFAEVARVLRTGGVFAFATLGPDSLIELREAWRKEDAFAHVNPFIDMHDVGDALVRGGLRDPVLDVDRLSITYPDADALFRDLTASGARSALRDRRGTLTGKTRLARVRAELEGKTGGGRLTVDMELVFGHAWGGGPPRKPGEYVLQASSIGRIRS